MLSCLFAIVRFIFRITFHVCVKFALDAAVFATVIQFGIANLCGKFTLLLTTESKVATIPDFTFVYEIHHEEFSADKKFYFLAFYHSSQL